MTNLPENFDYDNFLDMFKSTLSAILGLVFQRRYKDAMNKCIEAGRAIDALKENDGRVKKNILD